MAKLYAGPEKVFVDAKTVWTSCTIMPSMVGLRLCMLLECVFCLSTALLNSGICVNDLAMKAFECGNGWTGEGLYLCIHFQICLCTIKWRHHRMLKLEIVYSQICFFSPQGRQEVWKSRPLDYSCMPNLALMGEEVGTGVPKIHHVVLWPTGVTVYTSINVNFCLV